MANNESIVESFLDRVKVAGEWFVNDLAPATVDLATWFFRGNPDEIAIKLVGAFVVLTFFFVHAFKVPGHELSAPVSIVVLSAGVFFWGAALLVFLALLYEW